MGARALAAVALGAACCAAAMAQEETNPFRWGVPVGRWGGNCAKDSSPALAPDGTLYLGATDRRLHALRPDGTEKWDFETGQEIESSPAVGQDGTIYFGSRDGRLYAVTPDGQPKWAFATPAWVDSSPALARDGTVYFGSWDHHFYALTADGRQKWVFPTGGPIVSSPAIGADGTIYFGSHDQHFYALTPDGKQRWAFATGGPIISSPAIHSDGSLYFTSVDGRLYALERDGKPRWQLWAGGISASSPALDAAGNVFLGVNEGHVGVSPAGKLLWKRGGDDLIDPSPAVTDGGAVWFVADNGLVTTMSAAGAFLGSVWLQGRSLASPTIGPDGTIYLGTQTTKCYALKGSNGLARSAWPMFRRNPRHTGNVADER